MDRAKVAALAEERLDWRFKALPEAAHGLTAAQYLALGPTLDQLPTPLLTLDQGALDHNLRTMADWCAAAGVQLAPHGKTTMAPALWQAQLDAGAWGITLATPAQLRVARAFGVRRLLLANALLDPAGLRWIRAELDADPGFEFTCWADSPAVVARMQEAVPDGERPVDVLVELGGPGGRTGARDLDTALATARAIAAAPGLRLAGLGGYEGALAHDAGPAGLATVEHYLDQLVRLHALLHRERLTDGRAPMLLSAGGSAYFDQVARVLGAVPDTVTVLRSGAYLIHDSGFYQGISPLARGGGARALRTAMHGWARVVSRPEPALALLDGGKRDFPYDEGLPTVQRGRSGRPLTGRVTALNDQHAFLRDSPAELGEVVRLGLSHPCTAFDKWNLIPVLDDADAPEPRVVDLVRTFF